MCRFVAARPHVTWSPVRPRLLLMALDRRYCRIKAREKERSGPTILVNLAGAYKDRKRGLKAVPERSTASDNLGVDLAGLHRAAMLHAMYIADACPQSTADRTCEPKSSAPARPGS